MACISASMIIIFVIFYLSVYSDYLYLKLNVDKEYIGFIFVIMPASGFVSAPIIGLFSKKIPRIYFVQAAFFSLPIALILYGPSILF